MKLVVAEAGSAEMRSLLLGGLTVMASVEIAYVELRAALAAAERDGRFPGDHYPRAKSILERVWKSTSPLAVDGELVRAAAELAEQMGLRGYDAVHLAGLRRLGEPGAVSFACWDGRLRAAAASVGYEVHPA